MRKTMTNQEFITKAIKKHNNLFDYSKTIYTKATAKVIINCSIHGDFSQSANSHLQGFGCPKCGYKKASETKTKKLEDFIIQAKDKHHNKYDYNKVIYKHTDKKITIICPIHGEFIQRPAAHLEGKGCPKCRANYNGFTLTNFINICKNNLNSEPKVYIIRCFNDNEEFIKIGMTSGTVFNRFKWSRLPYEYEVIKEIKGSPEFIFNLEHSLHRKYKEFKYKPILSFCGETECFNINTLSIIKEK